MSAIFSAHPNASSENNRKRKRTSLLREGTVGRELWLDRKTPLLRTLVNCPPGVKNALHTPTRAVGAGFRHAKSFCPVVIRKQLVQHHREHEITACVSPKLDANFACHVQDSRFASFGGLCVPAGW